MSENSNVIPYIQISSISVTVQMDICLSNSEMVTQYI